MPRTRSLSGRKAHPLLVRREHSGDLFDPLTNALDLRTQTTDEQEDQVS